MNRTQRITEFKRLLGERILVLDGAVGTMIQASKPDEAAYRGQRFHDWSCDLKGNNDLLTLTQPALIREIHSSFLAAGADIIETNTFNSSAPSQGDYRMEGLVGELNLALPHAWRAKSPISMPSAAGSRGLLPARSVRPIAPARCRRASTIRPIATSVSIS